MPANVNASVIFPAPNPSPNRSDLHKNTVQNEDSTSGRPEIERPVKHHPGLACDPCRKRKLKCDRLRPTCTPCERGSVGCKYEMVRKKTGPRKGHLKHLYDRLAHMETLLEKTGSAGDDSSSNQSSNQELDATRQSTSSKSSSPPRDSETYSGDLGKGPVFTQLQDESSAIPFDTLLDDLLALDIEDLPPTADIVDQLDDLFFLNVYQTVPILHKDRFLAARDYTLLNGHLKGLRYAMWALAADASPDLTHLQEDFYKKARRNLLAFEDRTGVDLNPTLEQCQAWLMITIYEFRKLDMPVAWISVGRTVRLAQMLGLHRLDKESGETPRAFLPRPRDEIESEERRRTFWIVYWADQSASMGLGWPSSIREADITTKLPDLEHSFNIGRPLLNVSLGDVLSGKMADYSPLAGFCIGQVLLARVLAHLYAPAEDDQINDMNGNFWRRHREIDNLILEMGMRMPPYLSMTQAHICPFIVMHNIHWWVATLLLHQSGMLRAKKYILPERLFEESRTRSISAAFQITAFMRIIAYLELPRMHAFVHYAAYIAAKVFIISLEERGIDHEMLYSLRFLHAVLQSFSRFFTNAGLYLAQLEYELDKSRPLHTDDGDQGIRIKDQMWPQGFSKLPARITSTFDERLAAADLGKVIDPLSMLLHRQSARPTASKSQGDLAMFALAGTTPYELTVALTAETSRKISSHIHDRLEEVPCKSTSTQDRVVDIDPSCDNQAPQLDPTEYAQPTTAVNSISFGEDLSWILEDVEPSSEWLGLYAVVQEEEVQT